MIVSSLAEEGAEETVAALALGAADTLPKPGTGRFNGQFSEILWPDSVRSAGSATTTATRLGRPPSGSKCLDHRCAQCRPIQWVCLRSARRPAASTPFAICFNALPPRVHVPILITQHLPSAFMSVFARQLGVAAKRPALVAEDGMTLAPDTLYVAPGDAHLTVGEASGGHVVRLARHAVRSGCMPSVDPMLASVGAVVRPRWRWRRLDGHGPRRPGGSDDWLPVAAPSSLRTKPAPQSGACRGRLPRRARCRHPSARQARASRRLALQRALGARQRKRRPHPCGIARSPHRTATDDEPSLADRDRPVVRPARTRHFDVSTIWSPCLLSGTTRRWHPRWSRLCSTTKPIFSGIAIRSTCSQTRRCRLSPVGGSRPAASCLVGGMLDRTGSLFARHAVCGLARALGGLDRRHPRHRFSAAAIDRARSGTYSQFEVQRGLGDPADDPLVRGRRRRLARGAATPAPDPLPHPQRARPGADRAALSISSCAATSCSISARKSETSHSIDCLRPWRAMAG